MKTVALCMRGYSQKSIVLNTCIMTGKYDTIFKISIKLFALFYNFPIHYMTY